MAERRTRTRFTGRSWYFVKRQRHSPPSSTGAISIQKRGRNISSFSVQRDSCPGSPRVRRPGTLLPDERVNISPFLPTSTRNCSIRFRGSGSNQDDGLVVSFILAFFDEKFFSLFYDLQLHERNQPLSVGLHERLPPSGHSPVRLICRRDRILLLIVYGDRTGNSPG